MWVDEVVPNTDTRTDIHVMTRHTDTLTAIAKFSSPDTYTVTEAFSYGESVPALVGHVFSPSPTSEKVAYNPRTGEVAFGDYAGFI